MGDPLYMEVLTDTIIYNFYVRQRVKSINPIFEHHLIFDVEGLSNLSAELRRLMRLMFNSKSSVTETGVSASIPMQALRCLDIPVG